MTEGIAETPRIESFVLRFVEDAPQAAAERQERSWHAVILHVQSKEEKSFADMADAVAFIARYVPVGEFAFPGKEAANGSADLG